MATTTTPEVGTPAKTPVTLTPTAVSKVREIMTQQNPVPAGLRIGVVGGGCSGFSYSMSFENAPGMMDKVLNFDGSQSLCGRHLPCILTAAPWILLKPWKLQASNLKIPT